MPEFGEWSFFDSAVAARATLLSAEDALKGETLVSIETVADLGKLDELSYARENFPNFIRAIRSLSKRDQDLLLSYYSLGASQSRLAKVFSTTQTLASSELRAAMQRLTCSMSGTPTVESMRPVFEKAGVENLLPVAMSSVIHLYERTRSFQRVAEVLELDRCAVRREMRTVVLALAVAEDPQAKALASYVDGLLDKSSASGTGLSARQRKKEAHLYVKTASCLGSFRVRVEDAGFREMFAPRASH